MDEADAGMVGRGLSEFTSVETLAPPVLEPGTELGEPVGPGLGGASEGDAARVSRRWRTVWRVHFYAGMFALPMLVILALTGLVILYTDPIQNAVHGNVRTVVAGGERVSLDEQRATVERAFPELTLKGVTTPVGATRSTVFNLEAKDETVREVFVNPYTGEILGSMIQGADVVGLANRLHGFLNNDGIKVKLPMLSGIFGEEPAFADHPVGEIVVEILSCWGLVLAGTGIFLWWPRKRGTGKPLFLPSLARWRKGGRARWRDLHAVPGILFAGILVFFVTTGLPWASYWGTDFGYVSERIAPQFEDPPPSAVARTGDLDRFGNKIGWAIKDTPVPASGANGGEHHDGRADADIGGGTAGEAAPTERAATLSLEQVARVAREERVIPGYSIALPVDSPAEKDKGPVYGSYVINPPWPMRMSESATVYVDQFSGETIARRSYYDFGALSTASSFGIENHMGVEYGLVTRIIMTGGVLLLLWMAFTAVVMWWKRRPQGKIGIPRRPGDVALPRGLRWSAAALGVVYPLWGVSALLVLAFDRFVIRRTRRLRAAFGMRR